MIIEEQDNKSVKLFEKVISFINHLSEIDKNQEKNLVESILNIKEDKEWRDKELNKITDNDIKGISLSEFHVIECIGKNNMSNNIFIAKELNMTKGGISKINSKLLSKDIIKADKIENDKREIYYSLTEKGIALFKLHEHLHEKEREKLMKILSNYKLEEITTILKFLEDLEKVI
ncbi:MarR family transcriptional regulator [Clostridium botulinum]|uniref:MarR family transcriptional regulator n=1 Tax=Clostridium botulinum TaxID=1491 RepID=UPI0013FA6D43|nr:MarR family transcriptional regulator [Clostridium botulinum]MBN3408412.1 MarR family transcriptional regulator [Clostridium botulinum]MBY6796553.1 MarR family transcriptional regulator [Clostridium botulinum]MBY6864514.1 MarR family transcriptional regulator [Clostridium botulinum]MBY6873799.1 MarR family transcriptional regulator [Clostridium botulinum]MBY6887753.1 MarR family transcriptional regulator [Clostridium botulinum]